MSRLPDEKRSVEYCPVDPFGSLWADRPQGRPKDCGLGVEVDDLDRFIQSRSNRAPLQTLRAWKVAYRLIVCLHNRNCVVHWDFGESAQRVDGDCSHATATALASERVLRLLYRGRCSWEEAYHSGEWRFFQTAAVVSPREYLVPKATDVHDLLRLRHPYRACYECFVSNEVAKWRNSDEHRVRADKDVGLVVHTRS